MISIPRIEISQKTRDVTIVEMRVEVDLQRQIVKKDKE
jgi:hypothetical protein